MRGNTIQVMFLESNSMVEAWSILNTDMVG